MKRASCPAASAPRNPRRRALLAAALLAPATAALGGLVPAMPSLDELALATMGPVDVIRYLMEEVFPSPRQRAERRLREAGGFPQGYRTVRALPSRT